MVDTLYRRSKSWAKTDEEKFNEGAEIGNLQRKYILKLIAKGLVQELNMMMINIWNYMN